MLALTVGQLDPKFLLAGPVVFSSFREIVPRLSNVHRQNLKKRTTVPHKY